MIYVWTASKNWKTLSVSFVSPSESLVLKDGEQPRHEAQGARQRQRWHRSLERELIQEKYELQASGKSETIKRLYHPEKRESSWTSQLSDIAVPRSQYQHSSIDADSIRLLYIQPGSRNEDIHCRFETVKQSSAPTYEAVSYTWDNDPAIYRILVDSKNFYLRSNLHSALRHLRSAASEVCVWLDMVCIDQCNITERNHQVGKMRSIYTASVRTLVWLGEADASSKPAMDFISRILDPGVLCQENWLDDFGILALAQLMNRPWFKRMWVIQELAFAKESVLFCGDREVHFTDFSDAVDIVRSRLADVRVSFQQSPCYTAYEGLLKDMEDSRSVRLLDTLKDIFLRSKDGGILRPLTSLETLLYKFRDFQSTDPRDRIFALLGMARISPSGDMNGLPALNPDYNRTLLEVSTDFVMYCTRTSGSLDIIVRPWADVKRTPWQGDLLDADLRFAVPSWISFLGDLPFGDPRFENTTRFKAGSLAGGPSQWIYNAHDGTIADVRFGVDDVTRSYNGSLFAKGIALGEIEHLSTRMADGIVLKECLELIGGIFTDDVGVIQDISDSLWHMLCAGRDPHGNPAPSLYRISLLRLLRQTPYMTSIDTEHLLSSTHPRHLEEFLKRVRDVVWNRRAFRSRARTGLEGNFSGLAPRNAQVGDQICILHGCSVPVLLRPHRQSVTKVYWQLVGEAYTDGVMEGQAMSSISATVLMSAEEEFELR